MARAPRDQSAGVRHVICRGNRGQAIFADDFDRERYLRLLGAVVERLGWRVLAYCLMTNHVHLLLLVPDGTISVGVQLLSGGYAQAFNLRHGWKGHLFEGRFKLVLVEDEAHALEEIRYVPNNVQRSGVARDAADVDWRWSSYRQVAGLERALPFLDVEWTLALFHEAPERARAAYARFVRDGALRNRDRRRPARLLRATPSRPPRLRSSSAPSAAPVPPDPPAGRSETAHPPLRDMSRGLTPGRVPPGRVPDD